MITVISIIVIMTIVIITILIIIVILIIITTIIICLPPYCHHQHLHWQVEDGRFKGLGGRQELQKATRVKSLPLAAASVDLTTEPVSSTS